MKIKIPATSANLGVGFDTLGISMNLYNIFEVLESDETKLINFKQYNKLDNNLVYQTYSKCCKDNGIKEKAVSIELLLNDIPESRGLGSSASCILAGVISANEINNIGLTFAECVEYSADIEGHPDNVFAAAYGGLTAGFKNEDSYYYDTFEISDTFKFHVLIPKETGKTSILRDALPKSIRYPQCVSNLSRIIHLPKVLKSGNLQDLKLILEDKIHEQYRFKYIPHLDEIKKLTTKDDIIVKISGSGPTLLLISKNEINNYLTKEILSSYKLLKVQCGKEYALSIEY